MEKNSGSKEEIGMRGLRGRKVVEEEEIAGGIGKNGDVGMRRKWETPRY